MAGLFSRIPGGVDQDGKASPPRLWDPVIRLTHWSVSGIVLCNGLILKPGGLAHVWLGWIALSLLALRVIWGLVGPSEARFASFLPHPVAAMSHLVDLVAGRPKEYPSHNPLGAVMVFSLWGLLAVVIGSGLVMTGGKTPWRQAEESAAVAAGDWSVLVPDETDEDGAEEARDAVGEAGEDEEDEEEVLEEMHEIAANLILILALLHVAGVALESRLMRRNLLRAMTIGPRTPRE